MFSPIPSPSLDRRRFLLGSLTVAAAAGLTACSRGGAAPETRFVTANGTRVDAVERGRAATGNAVTADLRPAPMVVDLAGTTAATWGYGSVPAPVIRMTAGDRLAATLTNALPDPTTIHWHGLALRNDMDGVPHLTQDPVSPGTSFTYDFVAPHPGTYWFHPHEGTQLDRGLYGALVVEDPQEPLRYDEEWIVLLDDWLDGVTATPDEVLAELQAGMDMSGGMDEDMGGGGPMRMGNTLMATNSDVLGGDSGDVYYPHYLINGRPADDPETYSSKPGRRIRLRLINVGGDTAFRVALTGHRLTITHTDGFPVEAFDADAVLIGMGERYDAVVTLDDGVFALIAEAEGKQARARAIVRTSTGDAPASSVSVPQFQRILATADQLTAAPASSLPPGPVDREMSIRLTGSMSNYDWGLDDRRFDMANTMANPYPITEGERVRLTYVNDTDMWHPIHLHGHTYQHGTRGPRKDTSIVLPRQELTVDFIADNPGRWLTHCHNVYHGEAGMMGTVAYTS